MSFFKASILLLSVPLVSSSTNVISAFSSPLFPLPTSLRTFSNSKVSSFSILRPTVIPAVTSSISVLQAVTFDDDKTLYEKVATTITEKVISDEADEDGTTICGKTAKERYRYQLITLLRVGVPSIIAGIIAFFVFPALAMFLASLVNDAGVFAVLSQDSSQFVQNFLTVSGLLFSILIGQTYAFLYQQQEAVFYALFNEVTEAKSLLEQVALVCQGRAMYGKVLESISKYVRDDLKQLQADPAILISARPVDDPLESIMYMTSVGVPSSVYETVRSLRQARAARLGALQRKLPKVHMILLWLLATIELVSFPLLGAGTQTLGGYNILSVEGYLFGIMTFGIVMTMNVIGELYRPAGGAYNVDSVLQVMVRGLEEELKQRISGGRDMVADEGPSAQYEIHEGSEQRGAQQVAQQQTDLQPPIQNELAMTKQGGSVSDLLRLAKKVVRFVGRRKSKDNNSRNRKSS